MRPDRLIEVITHLIVSVSLLISWPADRVDASWRRHTIDRISRGADGVRLADVNGDGWLDIVTPWEEGGCIRLYFHPGPKRCTATWPAVTVGEVRSPEDAVLVDLDGDFVMDVVSCCEGSTRNMYVHWAPAETDQLTVSALWSTAAIPATAKKQMWMFAVPMDVDGRNGLDLIVGSKGANGAIGWLASPREPRDLALYKYRRLRDAGWVMSLIPRDMDDDGDLDVVVSDRKGAKRGVFWLENPGSAHLPRKHEWQEHSIGGERFEVMFLDLCDLDGDGRTDILAATRNGSMLLFQSIDATGDRWSEVAIPNPFEIPHGKSVCVGDVDLDGQLDIVHSANTGGDRQKPGVAWMKRTGVELNGPWQAQSVSGNRGIKFDLVQLIDIDRDGDLDILTCEERDGLGVLWYENPTR